MRFRLVVLAVLLLPVSVLAASWRHFDGHSLHFSLKYPSGWHVAVLNQPPSRQVTLSHGAQALIVTLLPSPAKSLSAAVARFHVANPSLSGATWSRTSLGGRPAMWAALHPQTEGGVHETVGIIIGQWHSIGYELTIVDYGSGHATSLGQFPAVYSQIVRSWRFS